MSFAIVDLDGDGDDDDDDIVTKAQSCDLHHCQLLIGRIRQLTAIDDTIDITDTDPTCTSTHLMIRDIAAHFLTPAKC